MNILKRVTKKVAFIIAVTLSRQFQNLQIKENRCIAKKH